MTRIKSTRATEGTISSQLPERFLKINSRKDAKDGGILDGIGSVGFYDVLDEWLHEGPAVDLETIASFHYHGVVGLVDYAVSLQADGGGKAVVAIGQGKESLIIVPMRDETFVNQASLKVEGIEIVVLRCEGEQTEQTQSLVQMAGIPPTDGSVKAFVPDDTFAGRNELFGGGLPDEHLVVLAVESVLFLVGSARE